MFFLSKKTEISSARLPVYSITDSGKCEKTSQASKTWSLPAGIFCLRIQHSIKRFTTRQKSPTAAALLDHTKTLLLLQGSCHYTPPISHWYPHHTNSHSKIFRFSPPSLPHHHLLLHHTLAHTKEKKTHPFIKIPNISPSLAPSNSTIFLNSMIFKILGGKKVVLC